MQLVALTTASINNVLTEATNTTLLAAATAASCSYTLVQQLAAASAHFCNSTHHQA
jgi:hypothetical protein